MFTIRAYALMWNKIFINSTALQKCQFDAKFSEKQEMPSDEFGWQGSKQMVKYE